MACAGTYGPAARPPPRLTAEGHALPREPPNGRQALPSPQPQLAPGAVGAANGNHSESGREGPCCACEPASVAKPHVGPAGSHDGGSRSVGGACDARPFQIAAARGDNWTRVPPARASSCPRRSHSRSSQRPPLVERPMRARRRRCQRSGVRTRRSARALRRPTSVFEVAVGRRAGRHGQVDVRAQRRIDTL